MTRSVSLNADTTTLSPILGPQPLESGTWVTRVWMPEAHRVTLLLGGQEIAMATPHHPWIFEAEHPTDPGCNYSVRVERGGITHEQHDPLGLPRGMDGRDGPPSLC